jgi:hypothetical protein
VILACMSDSCGPATVPYHRKMQDNRGKRRQAVATQATDKSEPNAQNAANDKAF